MKKLFAITSLSLCLAACSNEDVPNAPEADSMTDTPIGFNMGVEDLNSRAGYAAGTITEGSAGFFMTTAGIEDLDTATASKYKGDNRKLTYTDSQWAVEGYPLLWRNKTAEVSYYAYYPYIDNGTINDGFMTVTIPTDQDKDGALDFLYGKGTTTGADSENGINIKLSHKMSKLIVNLTPGADLGDVEFESVVITGIATKAKFNVSNENYIIHSGNFVDFEDVTDINMIKHDNGTTFEAIIFPLDPDQFSIDITTSDNRKFYYKRGDTRFKKGEIHTLNIKIGKDKVDAKISAKGWNAPAENNKSVETI